jgi:hypothetical protein
MIIYSISCQLRHRQEIALGRDRHGPFDKLGLICLGILGLTARPEPG